MVLRMPGSTGHSCDEFAVGSKNALVLEGGGYRGVYTAGVLDVLMENGIWDFASVWGTSAGALNAASYKSRQVGRTIRIMLAFRDDKRLMSLRSLARTGSLAGGDFLYGMVQQELDPSDDRTFNANPLRMFACASDVVFGASAYLECRTFPQDVEMVKASASMPMVSPMVEIEVHRYLDGGTTDSVPVEAALGMDGANPPQDYVPARRALVVLTRDRAYQKGNANEMLAVRSHRYDEYPYYVQALETRAERYMAQRETIWSLEREGRALVIAPERPVEVAVAEHQGAPLLDLYQQGRQQTAARLGEIRSFLAAD